MTATTRLRSTLRPSDALAAGAIGLRVRRGRTILTALGIAIGIAAMVAVVGISASSRADLLAKLDRLGTNLLEVSPGQTFLGEQAALPEEATAMIERIGPVERASGVGDVDATVRRSDKIPSSETGGISVKAADPTLLDTLELSLRDGRFLDAATVRYPTVVLGATAARVLGIDHVDIDGTSVSVYLGGHWFTVIGILEPVELVPSIDRSVLIGTDVARDLFGYDGSPSKVYVRTHPDAVNAVWSVLGATANPEAPNEVQVSRPSDALEARAATDETLTALLLGLGGVALLVGGVGIANVMIISVLERRTEIGMRRALGATRRHVWVQFVLESTLLSLLGGAAGLVLGALVTTGYAHARDWTLDLPVEALAGGVAVALAVGAIAGLYPAARAARLAPADAVRPM
ncbi:MAG TPA: ABC transporter permease [Acidimicrobiales bacterium]